MNHRSAPLPKSPLNTQSFLRRARARFAVSAVALSAGVTLFSGRGAKAADTQYNVINGKTDLTATATYTTGGTSGTGVGGTPATNPPSVTSDILFDSGVTYSSTAFTLNSSATFGSLNDLSSTALSISNTGTAADTLTLGGTGFLGDGVIGSASADLLFVGTGASLTINGGTGVTALGIVLGQSGNFDIAGTASISSIISGATFGITKTGAGTLTLSGANTYTGATSIAAGTLSTGTIVVASGASGLGNATSSVGLGGASTAGILSYTGATATYTRGFTVGAGGGEVDVTTSGNTLTIGTGAVDDTSNGNFTLGGAGNFTVTSAIGGGSGAVIKNGAGTANFSGTNTYTGGTTINFGLLEFAKTVSMPSSGTVTANAGSTLAVAVGGTGQFAATGTGPGTLAGIFVGQGTGTSTVTLNSGSYVGVDTGSSNVTYGTPITNAGVGLNKLGASSLILTAAETYTGPTFITAGTLQLGIGTTGNDGSISNSPSVANNGTLAFNLFGAQTYAGSIGGGGAVTKAGAGTLTLSGVNTFTGATSVTGGTLDLANSLALQNSAVGFTAPGAITFDSSVTSNAFVFGGLTSNANNSYVLQNTAGNAINLQIGNSTSSGGSYNSATTGVFSGLGSLTEFGFSNTLTLASANTYTGATTINGGTINLGNGGTTGSISSSSALVLGGSDGGGTLAYTRTGTVAQTFNGTTITQGENFITTSTGTQTLNLGAITGLAGGTVDINPNTTSAITTTNGNVNGILGGYATFGGKTTWAVAPATPGGAITGLAAGSYTASATAGTTPANYANANVDVTASEVLTGAITPNSLRFNMATAYTLTLAGLNTIQSGGILNTPTATNGGTISGGTLTSASGQLAITTAGGTVAINSLIVDNGGPTAVAISGTGGGRQVGLNNGNNSYSGGTYLNGSGLNQSGGTSFGTGDVYFGNANVYTGAAGGGITFGTANVVITSGLIHAANGNNSSNGDISGNSGGIWNLIGANPSSTATWAGIVGSYSGSRVANFNVEQGTEIIGNNQLGISAVIASGGTYQVGTGYWGYIDNSKQAVSLTLQGGNFVEYGLLAGTTSQPFNSGLVINSGASTATAVNNSGVGTLVSFNAAGSRAVGGTANLVLPAGTQNAINGFTTVNTNTNGILGGYLTVGGTDWATNATNASGGNIIGLSNSTINAYSTDTFGTGLNTNVTTSDAFPAGSTNSIRFNTAGASTVTLSGTGIVTSGGILVTPTVGANLTTITGGTLEGANTADLVVIQNNTSGGLEIDSVIANNTGVTGLTKSGAGLLTLTGANSYTGGTFINGGVLNTTAGGINSTSATNGITINGGTLQAAGTITTAKAVAFGTNGGTIDTNGNAVTLSGVVSGTPGINNGGSAVGAGAFGGFNSSGVYAFTKNGAGTLTLSNIANTFGGGLHINNGTVADGSASGTGTFGTGYVTFGTSNTPTMSLGSHNVTIAGLIGSGGNGVVTGGVAGNPVITLDGVSTQSFGGTITNGSATSVGLTVNLSNPTESQILTGTNTYSGTTTLTSGALQLGDGTAGHDGTVASAITDNTSLVFNYNGPAMTMSVISGTGTVTKTGVGTAILTASNTYTGTTSVTGGTLNLSAPMGRALNGTSAITVNNSGTLLFSQPNQLNATTPAPITVGTTATQTPASTTGTLSFATGAYQGTAATETGGTVSGSTTTGGTIAGGPTVAGIGALTLNNTATLAFGGANTTLVFGAFNPNGNVLNITGYSNTGAQTAGNSGSGTDDRLVFLGDQSGNFNDFNFGSGAGVGVGEVALDNNYFEITGITAVPEPSTWLAGFACFGFAGFRLLAARRKSRRDARAAA